MAQNNIINPNSDKNFIDNLNLSDEHNFPKFIKEIKITQLKQINNLDIEFKHPISVISGINRSGKTTILTTIACSCERFKKRNLTTGDLERHTWRDFMKFTQNDVQQTDYEYSITYKTGTKIETKTGKRKESTKKWSGLAKKEGQIKDRDVRYIDMSRLLPARYFGKSILNRQVSNQQLSELLITYLSYILEIEFNINTQFSYQDKDTYCYQDTYSSFNAATGEEVLIKLLQEILEAPKNSIILIDEIEAGLHPKIQRRLIEVLYFIARDEYKQFIITSHSPIVLSCVPNKSRIFISNNNGSYQCHQNKSINFILSRIDSIMYPLIDLCCEDDTAERIINKLIDELVVLDSSYRDIINVIVSGSAITTFRVYKAFKDTYSFRKIKTGYACILDADIKDDPIYNSEHFIYFLFGEYTNKNPEAFLVEQYLNQYPHEQLSYHLNNTNNHVLFQKMYELGIVNSNRDNNLAAFNSCWKTFTSNNPDYLCRFKEFIDSTIEHFTNQNL